MMAKRFSSLLIVAITIILSGCDNFLSETPDNRARLNSKEKIAELLVSAYPEASYITFTEAMSDNVEDNPSAFQDPRNSDAYFWRDISVTYQDSPENYWNACYAAIAAANHALKIINESSNPEEFNDQKGEALVARAYSHFMLVTLFAKVYNGANALSPGIPYVTKPETTSFKTYERKTVQYVYDMIEKDLLDGLPLINDAAYGEGGVVKYHFTKAAAHAFASRYYLFKGNYQKVIEHANQVVVGGNLTSYLRPWNTTYRSYSATELQTQYTRASEKSNLLLCETLSEWARSYNGLRYSTGAERFISLYTSNPINGSYAFAAFYTGANVYFVPKFREHFVRNGTNSNTGYPYTILPLLTIEEVLFNRAEAYIMQDQFALAYNDLDTWLSKRILNYDPNNESLKLNPNKLDWYYQQPTEKKNLMAAVLNFRNIEFLHEGMRWFDIIRHNIPVTHKTNTGEIKELPANDPRRVLQIPREAISLGGLEPNPR
jgi:starch-binding outer membrane protein, SusD/RagB family